MGVLSYLTPAQIDSIAVELGSRSTCVLPKVWDSTGTLCADPNAPSCPPPQVLQNGICVTPPVCTPPQILQNGVCVIPPNACGSDDDGDDGDNNDDDGDDFKGKGKPKPNKSQVIISTPATISGHAGEQMDFAVTAFDCDGRAVKIKAGNVPKGAKISSRYDSTLQMQTATFKWKPANKYAGKTLNVVFKAQTKSKGSDAAQSVPVQVLPATGKAKASRANAIVQENAIASAWYDNEAKQLEVTGQITFAPNANKAARDNAASAAVVVSHGQNDFELGRGTVDGEGLWSATIPLDVPPCAVDASFLGKTASKPVSGVAQCNQ